MDVWRQAYVFGVLEVAIQNVRKIRLSAATIMRSHGLSNI